MIGFESPPCMGARSSRRTGLTIRAIVEAAAPRLGLQVCDIYRKTRAREISHARQLVIALAWAVAGRSQSEIARHFGLHHTTALYALRAVEERLADDYEWRRLWWDLAITLRRAAAAQRRTPP